MTDIYLTRTNIGFVPASQEDADMVARFKLGDTVKATIVKPRGLPFLRKYFALLDVGYEAWDPETGIKNRKQFRNDITILAGYYEQYVRLDGSIRTVAKSISFANMEDDDFEKLYSASINVLLQRVLTNYTKDDLTETVDKILGFC